MRFIKSIDRFIFESIESKGISSTLSFLNKKCPEKTSDAFLKDLKRISNKFDYPMSKISDSHIKYLSKKAALPLKNTESIQNGSGIWCLKFWFSLEEGYLGYTSVGDKSFKYRSGIKDRNTPFDSNEMDYLQNNIPRYLPGLAFDYKTIDYYKSGRFVPIVSEDDYENLKTRDVIAGYFSDTEYENSLCWAVVWRDRDKIFAIQNKCDGSAPDGSLYRDIARYSWNIYSANNIQSDHSKLSLFVPGDSTIKKEDEEEVKEEPLDFNLPLSNLQVRKWTQSYDSVSDSNDLEKADFALILYLDDMLNPDKTEYYERPSDIRKERLESRTDALAYKTDEEIKEENIKRYIQKIVELLGISVEKVEFKDLNRMVLKSLMGKFALISILKRQYSKNDSISDQLYDMIEQTTIDDKEYYFEKVLRTYQDNTKSFNRIYNNLIESDKMMNSDLGKFFDAETKEMVINQYQKCLELGSYISDYVSKSKIENLADLRIISAKMATLNQMMKTDRLFRFDARFESFLIEFESISDVEYNLDRLTKQNMTNNESKLVALEKAIKSIFKQ